MAGTALDKPEHNGLTELGKQVYVEMNRQECSEISRTRQIGLFMTHST